MKVCYMAHGGLHYLALDSITHDPLVLTFLSILGADLMLYNMYFCKLADWQEQNYSISLFKSFLLLFERTSDQCTEENWNHLITG